MPDNFTIRQKITEYKFLEVMRMDNIKTTFQNNDENFIQGKFDLENLKIYVYPTLLIITGSLCKYYYGNNVNNIYRQNFIKIIEDLNKVLDIDISNAEITSIEFGFNFEVKNKVTSYFNNLLEKQYCNRFEIHNSLYFTQGNKKFIFYDKIKEARKGPIPKNFKSKNLMRFEVKYKGKKSILELTKYLGIGSLTLGNLIEYDVYKLLVERWKEEYHSIFKESLLPNFLNNNFSASDFKTFLAQEGARNLGSPRVFKIIQNLDYSNTHKETKSRIKKKFKELISTMENSTKSEKIIELDRQVNNEATKNITLSI